MMLSTVGGGARPERCEEGEEKSINKSISIVSFSFDHINPGWAALDGTMILYRRLAEGHGVTEHMIIGDTEPGGQVRHQ